MNSRLLALAVWMAMVWSGSHAQATVFWDDELESGNTGYNLGDLNDSSAMSFDTSFKHSGNGSLRLNYPSECYPDRILEGFQCGGFMDRTHTGGQTLFARFWFYLPSSFTVGDTETKVLSQIPGNFVWDIIWELPNGGRRLRALAVRGLSGNSDPYLTSTDIPVDQWTCIELQVTHNTIGSANGILRVWYNGTQVLNATNVTMLDSGDSGTNYINTQRFYRQVGEGNIWFDQFAVGTTRLNDCAGGGGSGGGPIVMFITQSIIATSALLQVLFIGGYFWERRTVAVQAAVKFWRYAAEVPTPKEIYWSYRYKKAIKQWQRQAPLMLEHQPMETIELPKQEQRIEL